MSGEGWDYYIRYMEPNDDPEVDGLIFRHRPGDPDAEGQRYVPSGKWIRSTTIVDLAFGHDDYELKPISAERARQLMNRWIEAGRFSALPDDWH